jgi:predicted O-methyltransferase YrrM
MINKINKYWFNDGHFNSDQRDYFIETLEKLKPDNILEIGFASGRSCITSLVAGQPNKMISLDIDLDYIGARNHAILMETEFPNLSIIEGNSNEVLNSEFFEKNFKSGVDFAFVDGCHNYECAKKDCENVYPNLNKGGVMVVDDYKSGAPNGCTIVEVDNAVNDFAKENNLLFETWSVNGKGFAIFKK